uniref:Uncharacterized protein n=1 Tax=Oryza sativa subsp. japonica TaxID=39947 RepID=Q84NN6_ORYSJ|nr:hypothetical protein [Oryza sativa Japonica Group]
MAEAGDGVCERKHGGRARASGSAVETVVVRLSGGEHRCVSRGLAGEWLPGESPVLGSFEPPTDGGGSFPSLLSLETSFRHPLAETTQTIGASTL